MIIIKYLFLITCISFALLKLILGNEGITLRIKGNQCNRFNPKFVLNISCRVRAFNRTVQLMSYETIYRPGVSLTDYRINITSYRKFGTIYRPSLVKLSENWCASMNGSMSHYTRIMSKSFKKYGNTFSPCPISGKRYVKDMIVDTSNFPQFAPIGEYRMDYHYYTVINGKSEFVSLLKDYWEVIPKGAMQF